MSKKRTFNAFQATHQQQEQAQNNNSLPQPSLMLESRPALQKILSQNSKRVRLNKVENNPEADVFMLLSQENQAKENDSKFLNSGSKQKVQKPVRQIPYKNPFLQQSKDQSRTFAFDSKNSFGAKQISKVKVQGLDSTNATANMTTGFTHLDETSGKLSKKITKDDSFYDNRTPKQWDYELPTTVKPRRSRSSCQSISSITAQNDLNQSEVQDIEGWLSRLQFRGGPQTETDQTVSFMDEEVYRDDLNKPSQNFSMRAMQDSLSHIEKQQILGSQGEIEFVQQKGDDVMRLPEEMSNYYLDSQNSQQELNPLDQAFVYQGSIPSSPFVPNNMRGDFGCMLAKLNNDTGRRSAVLPNSSQ